MSDDKPLWAVIELMGHVRIAGRVTEEERFGSKMGRVDIPQNDGSFITQYFGGGSVYRMTFVSEDAARAVAKSSRVEPVHQWEMPKLTSVAVEREDNELPFDEVETERGF